MFWLCEEAKQTNQLKSAKKEGYGMMSPSDEKRIIAMVDSFTKTVARNFSRNLKRAKANAEKHYSDEPVDYWMAAKVNTINFLADQLLSEQEKNDSD